MESIPASVRVLSVSRVAPAPAPAGIVKVKLSFLDALWIATPPSQQVFLYELGGGDEFPAVVSRLKDSLATALALYLPLAGKLAYAAETGDVVVDWSDGDAGVTFVEAEAHGGDHRMDLRRLLAGDAAHDVAAFLGLVPEHDARVLPAHVLLLQATRLGGGGLALGLSVHHAVVDGFAIGRFMDSWASAARRALPAPVTLAAQRHGREAAIAAHPRGDELAHEALRTLAPNLPVANAAKDYFSQRFRLARQTFHLAADEIRSLRRRIDALAASTAAEASSDAADAPKPVTTFVAVCALGWTAFVRAKGLAAGDDTYLLFQADLRARLRPPVGEGYFGNCIRPCLGRAIAGDLLGDSGLLRAARAIRLAVGEVEAAPLAGAERWAERLTLLPRARLVWVAGSPLFVKHESMDFGFGRPARTEPLTMNHDGRMVIVGGARAGEAQVTVSIAPAHMDAFKAHMKSRPMPKM